MMDCCELLIAEHRRTEDLLARISFCLEGLEAGGHGAQLGLAELQLLYETLAQELQRHYALEEKALFTVLSPYRSMMLMEVEHDDLLQLQHTFALRLEQAIELSTLGQAETVTSSVTGAGEEALLLESFLAFKERLLAHILEEERGVFPLANQRLEPEEKLKVLRLTNELVEANSFRAYELVRPEPGFLLKKAKLSEQAKRPMEYHTLFEREHSLVQTLRLQAGQRQALHWAGQTQVLIVLSGELSFETGQQVIHLSLGDSLTLDSRLLFALKAVTDSLLLVFKVWPHPHYTKT